MDEIQDLRDKLQESCIEATRWKDNFQRVVQNIMHHMDERYKISNLAYSYRVVLLRSLQEQGYTEEEALTFLRLEIAEQYLQERIKHKPVI